MDRVLGVRIARPPVGIRQPRRRVCRHRPQQRRDLVVDLRQAEVLEHPPRLLGRLVIERSQDVIGPLGARPQGQAVRGLGDPRGGLGVVHAGDPHQVAEPVVIEVHVGPALGFVQGFEQVEPDQAQGVHPLTRLREEGDRRFGLVVEAIDGPVDLLGVRLVPLGLGLLDPIGQALLLVAHAAFEPPGGGGGAFDQEASGLGGGLPVVHPGGHVRVEGGAIFGRQDDFVGSESVFQAIQPGSFLAGGGAWSGGLLGVLAVGVDAGLAGHGGVSLGDDSMWVRHCARANPYHRVWAEVRSRYR